MKLKLKGCPRCRGALALNNDRYGIYEECIQCGYIRDIPLKVESKIDMDEFRADLNTGATADLYRAQPISVARK